MCEDRWNVLATEFEFNDAHTQGQCDDRGQATSGFVISNRKYAYGDRRYLAALVVHCTINQLEVRHWRVLCIALAFTCQDTEGQTTRETARLNATSETRVYEVRPSEEGAAPTECGSWN